MCVIFVMKLLVRAIVKQTRGGGGDFLICKKSVKSDTSEMCECNTVDGRDSLSVSLRKCICLE